MLLLMFFTYYVLKLGNVATGFFSHICHFGLYNVHKRGTTIVYVLPIFNVSHWLFPCST